MQQADRENKMANKPSTESPSKMDFRALRIHILNFRIRVGLHRHGEHYEKYEKK